MRLWDPAHDGAEGETYRESTFVARPGETVRPRHEAEAAAKADAADADERVEALRVEIEETRTELSGTVDAIQEKLNPAALADQAKEHAKEAVYDATVGRAEHMVSGAGHKAKGIQMTIMDTIRGNPMAAAAAGLSLGWLWMKRPKDEDRDNRYMYPERAGAQYGSGYAQQNIPGGYYGQRGYYGQAGSYGQGGSYTGSRASYAGSADQGGGITDKVGDAAGAVRGQAGNVASAAGDMAEDAWSGARGMAGTAGETATDLTSTLVDTITRNPLPAALTGIGLAWLWMGRSSDGDRPYYAHSGRHYWQGNSEYPPSYGSGQQGGMRGMAGDVQERAGRLAGGVQERAGQVAGGVAGAAGQVKDSAGNAVGTVADTAGDVASTVMDTAGEFAGGMQYRARRTGSKFQDMLDENPLMAGAMAVAAGLAVGLMAPSTEREREMMGETREKVMQQAKETVRETVDKAKQVASETAGAAQETAREEAQKQKLGV
jgi:hypothetical protein